MVDLEESPRPIVGIHRPTTLILGLFALIASCSDSTDSVPPRPAQPPAKTATKTAEKSAETGKPDDIEKLSGLKSGVGREHVVENCLPCHSGAIIAANHLRRDDWADVIIQMQTKNGMPPIPDEVREGILTYLETAQRPEDVGLNAGKSTPWAAPLYRPNPLWK